MVKYGGSIIGKTLMVSSITHIYLESPRSKVFPLLFSAQSDDSVQIKKVEGFRGSNARSLNVKLSKVEARALTTGPLRCPMTGPAPPNELAGVSELGLGLRNGLDPIEVFPKAQFS